MELSKKSELTVGSTSYVIETALKVSPSPSIVTEVSNGDGVVFDTSQDVSELSPLLEHTQTLYTRVEEQHLRVIKELEQGRMDSSGTAGALATGFSSMDQESDALEHALALLSASDFEKATSSLRAVLETYPTCSEARELLEVAYKCQSGAVPDIDVSEALQQGSDAFADGRQRDAIEAWKRCLTKEPGNRMLQLLVMLATTWSPERRAQYANEVLAAGSLSMSQGRPEEAQALLLVAQTVEQVSDETMVGGELESLVSETPPDVANIGAPGESSAKAEIFIRLMKCLACKRILETYQTKP